MANKENLRPPWPPGQSGNPNGRKQGNRPVASVLRELIKKRGLEDDVAEVWLGATLGDQKLLKGRKPDAVFFRELLDRLDGPVPKPAPHDADKTLEELLGLVD